MKHIGTLVAALLVSHLCFAQDVQPVIHEFPLDSEESVTEDMPFTIVEVMPAYPGGDKALLDWIGAQVSYPNEVKKQNIEGKVFVRFIIGTEGSIESANVLRGVHPLLDAEALRVVKSIKGFSPGLQRGKAVRVQYIIPVVFRL